MTTTLSCVQCGSINRLAAEICQQCGAELHRLGTPADAGQRNYTEESSILQDEFAPEIGPFTGINSVLTPTITLFKDNFWLISKVVLALFAPLELFKAMAISRDPLNWQATVGAFFLTVFCSVLATPSVIYAVVVKMQTGVTPQLNEVYRYGLSKIWKVIAASTMAGFLAFVGFVCLIIPGIILSVAFELVYPIVALENLSAIDSLKRSYNLTKGHRWNIFITVFVFTLLTAVVNIPVSVAAGIVAQGGAVVWTGAIAALLSDFLSQGMTVLSLVMYIGILKSHNGPATLTELPPFQPAFEKS